MTIQGIKKDLVKKAAKAMVPRLREEFLSKGGRQEDFDEALAMNRVCSFFESQPPVFWDQIAISEDTSLDDIAQDIADSLEESLLTPYGERGPFGWVSETGRCAGSP